LTIGSTPHKVNYFFPERLKERRSFFVQRTSSAIFFSRQGGILKIAKFMLSACRQAEKSIRRQSQKEDPSSAVVNRSAEKESEALSIGKRGMGLRRGLALFINRGQDKLFCKGFGCFLSERLFTIFNKNG
jgi:hypothetical protein